MPGTRLRRRVQETRSFLSVSRLLSEGLAQDIGRRSRSRGAGSGLALLVRWFHSFVGVPSGLRVRKVS